METKSQCPSCKAAYEVQPVVCAQCYFPFEGSEDEKAKFIARQIMNKGHISDTKERIKRARILLFIIAGTNIVFPFFMYAKAPLGPILIALSVVVGLVFLFFAFRAQKKPFSSIGIPFILLLASYILGFVIDPASLFRGLLWKGVIISGLGYALWSINKSKQIYKESKQLNP